MAKQVKINYNEVGRTFTILYEDAKNGKLIPLFNSTYRVDDTGNVDLTGLLFEEEDLFVEALKVLKKKKGFRTFSFDGLHTFANQFCERLKTEKMGVEEFPVVEEESYPIKKFSFTK